MAEPPAPTWQSLWHDLGVPAVLALGAAVVAWVRRVIRTRAERQRLRRVELDAVRKSLDGVRQALWVLRHPEAADNDDVQASLAVTRHEVDEVREQLWVATGHQSKRDTFREGER